MAYVANIVTEAEMVFMAGEDVDTTGNAEANHITLQDDAEGYLSLMLKRSLAGTGFTDLDATVRKIITEWAARYAGVQLIAYKMTGEANALAILEAEDRINVHIYRMEKIEDLLSKSDFQDFLKP